MILQGFARIMTMRRLVAQGIPAGVFCALASLCALAQVRPLELGKAVERELAGGAQHSYQLQLSAGQFLHVIVDQRGIDAAVKLFAPDGKAPQVAEVLTFLISPEPLIGLPRATGDDMPIKLPVALKPWSCSSCPLVCC